MIIKETVKSQNLYSFPWNRLDGKKATFGNIPQAKCGFGTGQDMPELA
jgi:hypothetical protein